MQGKVFDEVKQVIRNHATGSPGSDRSDKPAMTLYSAGDPEKPASPAQTRLMSSG